MNLNLRVFIRKVLYNFLFLVTVITLWAIRLKVVYWTLNKTLLKKRPYSELFWSVFPRIRTEYGEIGSMSSYSIGMRENTDENNSEYGHFLRSESLPIFGS